MMDGWMDGCVERRIGEWMMEGWMDGCMIGWMDGRPTGVWEDEGRIDGWMEDGLMERRMSR